MGPSQPHPADVGPPSAPEGARASFAPGFQLTREGGYWLLIAAVVLGIGYFKSINLLLLLGYLLLLIAAFNAMLAGRRLHRLRARRRIAAPAFVGSPCVVEVQIDNPHRRGVPAVRVEDHGPDHALAWFIDRLEGRGESCLHGEVVLPRRGRYAWEPVTVVSGYPFGLSQRRVLLAPGEEVIVLPRLGWLHRGRLRRYLRGADPQRDRTRQRPQRHPGAQAEFHGLRSYRTGDSPRLIHWRTSARCGELMVREFEDLPGENLLLVFDPTLPPGCDPLVFESAVSLAATICWEWGRHTGERLLLAVGGLQPALLDGLATPRHVRRALESLAVQEPTAATDARGLLACLQTGRLPSAAVLVVGIGANRLARMLEQKLRRPVAYLNAAAELDCYEAPRL
jgi:uncharacterized protein (DUF58 family)